MAGYIGSKAVLLSTTAAVVTGDMAVAGDVTIGDDLFVTGPDPVINIVETGVNGHRILGAGGILYIQAQDSDGTPDGDMHLTGYNNNDLGLLNIKSANTTISGDMAVDTNTLYVDSTNNRVGVGTTTPSAPLQVASAAGAIPALGAASSHAAIGSGGFGTMIGTKSTGVGYIQQQRFDGTATAYDLLLQPNGGSVGIGTSSPSYTLDVNGGTNNIVASFTSTDTNSVISFGDNTTAPESMYLGAAGNDMLFNTNGAEAMRIDSSGNVLVGTTTALGRATISSAGTAVPSLQVSGGATSSQAKHGIQIDWNGFYWGSGSQVALNIVDSRGAAATDRQVQFSKGGSVVGNISCSLSATAYATSSDYRLKENVTPIQGAADTVMAMQPCTYTAIADGLWYDGFLAHELQEVHPRAVTGTKDAMKDEGYEITPATETEEAVMGTRSVPDMQSVDYSKITPILTAALQEALTEIAALKVRVAALEVTP